MSVNGQKRSLRRYSHTEGHTDLCFSDDGKFVITCGSEGDIRIWKGIDDDPTDKGVGERAFAVAQKGDKLYVGSDHNNVQIFTFPELELDGILTRFTAPVTTISVSVDGTHVAAGSCDMEIHLVEVATSKATHFTGHKAPILRVAIDPKLEYIASSSCDGTVRVWQISDQSVVKSWSNVTNSCNSFEAAESICGVSWEPQTGRLFAVPFPTGIQLFQRSTWNVSTTLTDQPTVEKFCLTSWSSCGRFLAGSALNGRIVVWNTLRNCVVSASDYSENINICALSWNPASVLRQIAYCDVNGYWAVVEDCFSSPETAAVPDKVAAVAVKRNESDDDIDFGDDIDMGQFDDDDDDPNVISLKKIKSDYNSFIEEEETKDTEDDGVNSLKSYPANMPPPMPMIEIQAPFQPTSTPIHLQRRFMVFNDVGHVKQTNTEEENMIDVDFHDISIHHAFRVNNILRHILAALSSEALVLACEKTEETSSKVVCRLFNSWDDSKEWSLEMSEDESIEAVAVGNKWVAVVTSLWFLRIYSLSGNQRDIVTLPGPILTMCGLQSYLMVVYHTGPGLPENQNLAFQIFKIEYQVEAVMPAQPLPLSPQTGLKWIGFSDELNPCVSDSSGLLKLYSYKLGVWRPICNVDEQWKGLSNHHFVIGVSEEMRKIRCIFCKGSYYPATTPHPFITEICWKVPVCEPAIEKGVHEEKLWQSRIAKDALLTENNDLRKETMQTALKLFALSCQTSHEMRAFELCDYMNSAEFTEFASKYAARSGNNSLVDRLSDLRQEQLRRADEQVEYDFGRRYRNRKAYSPPPMRGGYSGDQTESEPYESQELFPQSDKRTQDSVAVNGVKSEPSESLIMEMKKKKKTLSEQKNQIIPRRKIVNPFRKGLQHNSILETQSNGNSFASTSHANKDSQDVTNGTEENSEAAEITTADTPEETQDTVKQVNSVASVLPKPNKKEKPKEPSPNKNPTTGATRKKRKTLLEEENTEEKIEKRKVYFKLQGFAFTK